MDIASETRTIARLQLAQRIDAVARECLSMTPARLAFAVDDIRREAYTCRFAAVAALASGLERAMARSAGSTIVIPFLQAMGDAVASDDDTPGAATAWLGAVGMRLNG